MKFCSFGFPEDSETEHYCDKSCGRGMMKAPRPATSMEQTANLQPSLSADHFLFAVILHPSVFWFIPENSREGLEMMNPSPFI